MLSYATALDQVLRAMPADSPSIRLLITMADEVDSARDDLIRAAEDVAEAMNRIAECVARGVPHTTVPQGAMTRASNAQLQLGLRQEIFWKLAFAALGSDGRNALHVAAVLAPGGASDSE